MKREAGRETELMDKVCHHLRIVFSVYVRSLPCLTFDGINKEKEEVESQLTQKVLKLSNARHQRGATSDPEYMVDETLTSQAL